MTREIKNFQFEERVSIIVKSGVGRVDILGKVKFEQSWGLLRNY